MNRRDGLGFQRRANPLPGLFRLAFIHGAYAVPAWFILKDISRDSLPGLLGTVFSTFIVVTVFLIRLRRILNGSTERRVRAAVEAGDKQPLVVEQSFSFKEYVGLQAEVMFSHLRPWMTTIVGLVFLVLFGVSVDKDYDVMKKGLSLALTLYLLALPWLVFSLRVRKVYKRSENFMKEQSIEFAPGKIALRIGAFPEKLVHRLTDIAITRNYVILTVAGSNYIQIKRRHLDVNDERSILAIAAEMVRDPES